MDELIELIPEWKRLESYCDGFISIHTYLVTYLTWTDPRVNKMHGYERNILRWASLLHDVTKRGHPEILGKDHVHPFTGGGFVLEFLHRSGMI